MHCDCCDKVLSDYECSIKHRTEGHYLNTCMSCLKGLGIPFIGNATLSRKTIDPEEASGECEDDCSDDLIYTNVDKFIEEDEYNDEE